MNININNIKYNNQNKGKQKKTKEKYEQNFMRELESFILKPTWK